MIHITFFEHGNTQGQTIQGKVGQSLMQAASAADIEGIAADCGGTLTCATCHVMVRPACQDKMPALSDDEDGMLDFAAASRQPNSRLSCQIKLTEAMDGLEVDLPESQY
jgi:2Fe-2S ferredoxin